MSLPIQPFYIKEVVEAIAHNNVQKAPEYDGSLPRYRPGIRLSVEYRLAIQTQDHIPCPYYLLLKKYLHSRYFQVKYSCSYSTCYEVLSGVPQGSALGHLIYLIFPADLPTTTHTSIAKFADDTGLLAVHTDPTVASQQL